MTALLMITLGVALWFLVPLPVAVVVGRAFRAGEMETELDRLVRDYDAAGV